MDGSTSGRTGRAVAAERTSGVRATPGGVEWQVENLGYKVNTEKHEYEFLPSPDGKSAILMAEDRLYQLTRRRSLVEPSEAACEHQCQRHRSRSPVFSQRNVRCCSRAIPRAVPRASCSSRVSAD